MSKRFTEGICGDGAAILDSGKQITITEILNNLNRLDKLEQLKLCGVGTRFLSVKQLKEACKKHKYILVRMPSGHKMGINTKVADIVIKHKNYNDNDSTDFISFLPCDFSTYITYKHKFK